MRREVCRSLALQKLGDVCEIRAGTGFPKSLQGKTTGDVPFFKVGDISRAWQRGETVLRDAEHYITSDEMRTLRARPLPANSVVFAKIGAAIGLNRRAVLAQDALVDNNIMGVYGNAHRVVPRYLFHFMCTMRLLERSRASVVPSLRKSDIENLEIPLPDTEQQRAVVARIEELFSDLDAGVAALERAKGNLARYRAAVLEAAVEGRVTKEWRRENPDVEPASEAVGRTLTARGAQNKRGAKRQTGRPPVRSLALAPSWAAIDLATLVATDAPIIYGILQPGPNVPGGVPYVRPTEIQADRIVLSGLRRTSPAIAKRYARATLRPGDVILSIVGTIGKVAIVPPELDGGNITQSSARVRADSTLAVPEYVAIALRSRLLRAQYDAVRLGTAVPRLNLAHVRDLVIPLPPLTEQAEIISAVSNVMSLIDHAEHVVETAAARSTTLRQAVLRAAFAGRLAAFRGGA